VTGGAFRRSAQLVRLTLPAAHNPVPRTTAPMDNLVLGRERRIGEPEFQPTWS
jgi:hypothetical protein